jgi:hypothetical protein
MIELFSLFFKARNLIVGMLAFLIWTATGLAADIMPEFPPNGGIIETPMSAKLAWSKSDAAVSYRLTLRLANSSKPILEVNGVQTTSYPVPLRPDTSYQWNVDAFNAAGELIASGGPFSFKTPPVVLKEVTDPVVLFKGWRPGVRFVCDAEPGPVDPQASVSPWYDKKSYTRDYPPTFGQLKDKLPVPVWDGHKDSLDMYWYAWKILFTVWIYPPNANSDAAVSNLLGCPTWAGWGSTMIWDSAFIIQFSRYGNRAYPVVTALDNCYARQHENGFICRESDNGNQEVDSVWPVNLPLLAWAEWGDYQINADADRLRKVFMPLVKNYEWTMLNMRRPTGLYWNKGLGDGMDDSPRNFAHSYVSFSSVMAMNADILGQMAKTLGRDDLADWFAGEYSNLKDLINANFWDSQYNLYNDLGKEGKSITLTDYRGLCKAVSCFWPMIAGVVPPDHAVSLAGHLSDSKTFNRSSGTATLSADSRDYNHENGSYWHGAVWPPTQYMVIEGLKKCGNEELAYTLSAKYYNAFLTAYLAKKDITEFIAPDKPEMFGCPKFVGWGGLAPIAILFEDLFGLGIDGPANTITWRIRQTDRHGVQNLAFGGSVVSLICDTRKNPTDPCTITIDADKPFNLVLERHGGSTQKQIPAGHSTLSF